MIASYLSQVAEWNRAFKYRQPEPITPELCDVATNALRSRLIAEELHELRAAIEANDRLETLDALADIQYVLSGAVLAWGLRKAFDHATITLRLQMIASIDEHLAQMFGLNAMMEIIVESRNATMVAMYLRDLQSHLSQMVYHFGFAPVFSEAFAEVHRSNLSKLWTREEMESAFQSNPTVGLDVHLFDISGDEFIARRKDGKIVKSPGYSPANLAPFI